MTRKFALRVEQLEVRELLSNLAYSLTTNKPVYQVGQPVDMTFTETNVSDVPVTVEKGPSIDGFNVSLDGKVIWRSNAGNNPMSVVMVTLQPQHSLTETATWYGVTGPASSVVSTGTFTVTNQLAPQAASAAFEIASPITLGVSTNKSTYQVGEPIQLSFTETNPSTSTVAISVVPPSFDVFQGINSIWVSANSGKAPAPITVTLGPGQSNTQTTAWDGTNNTLWQSTNNWGTFVVTNANDPQGTSATFQIMSPLKTTVSTDQPTYQVGQTIVMSLQETNTSNQTITFLPDATTFNVEQQGGSVVYSVTTPNATATETLQPGQSFTEAATWNGIALGSSSNTPSTGSFVVTNSAAQQGSTASFLIAAPVSPTPTPTPTTTPTPTPTTSPTPTTTPTPAPTSSPTPTNTPAPTPTTTPISTKTPTPTPTLPSTTIPVAPVALPIPTPTPTPTTTPTPVSSVLKLTLTTNRAVYRRGSAVRLMLTLNNTGSSAIGLTPNASTDGITVRHGSTVIWHLARSIGSNGSPLAIERGASTQLSTTWNGRSSPGGPKRLLPGLYTIVATEGGYTATTTIRITA